MGRYEVDWSGPLPGLRIGRIRADFQMAGISALWRERLKREVKNLMPLGPKCLR